jgi:glycosyltransferase involved in cell wall biosynthesis
MQRTAIDGRGIQPGRTSVTYLGVDTAVFRPRDANSWYAHDSFGIPRDRRIVYYSGHMEERKGVHILLKAIVELVEARGRTDTHLLILGNRPGEDTVFAPLYRGTAAEPYITFGGYRRDIPDIIPGCYVGAIASTGWDSFTASSLEIAACGLPLVVSRLQGLQETVEEDVTGFTFTVADHSALADRLQILLGDPAQREQMGRAARQRIEDRFTIEHQIASLVETVRLQAAKPPRRWNAGVAAAT